MWREGTSWLEFASRDSEDAEDGLGSGIVSFPLLSPGRKPGHGKRLADKLLRSTPATTGEQQKSELHRAVSRYVSVGQRYNLVRFSIAWQEKCHGVR